MGKAGGDFGRAEGDGEAGALGHEHAEESAVERAFLGVEMSEGGEVAGGGHTGEIKVPRHRAVNRRAQEKSKAWRADRNAARTAGAGRKGALPDCGAGF